MTRFLRLAGFGAAGASGVLPNLAVMWLLVDHLHVHYLPAAVVATEVAICWNFALVDLVVFRARRTRPWPARFARFVLLNNADLAVRLPLLAALVSWWGANELVANLATLVVAFVLRFGITDRFIYRRPPAPALVESGATV
ncbi:GtrA family protein [Dactylosporangium sp. AC04546]|uniref:GtrA family protein n=1 Tax=Dactylosporangium sp. AC04546 TaxID=2862460 RepID=UPI001EDD5B1F|nr:GtrA family protein [Dactylosporangium sp. AC04546]WVK79764.1 GtrA family protein [Dactylosporangium sp. AC04546]